MRRAAGVFDVSHMCVDRPEGRRACATFLQHLLANDVGRLTTPGKALYSCMLQRGRRRPRRPDRLLTSTESLVPPGGQRRHARQGPRLDPRARRRLRRRGARARATWRCSRVQGPEARAKAAQLLAAADARRGAGAGRVRAARSSAHGSSPAPATPARTASRSCCPRRMRCRAWRSLNRARRRLLRSRRARHAAPGGRHEPVRQRHGREHPAARVRARRGRWPSSLPGAISSAARRSRRCSARRFGAQARGPAARGPRRAAQSPEGAASHGGGRGRNHQRHVLPDARALHRPGARPGRHRRRRCRSTSAASS